MHLRGAASIPAAKILLLAQSQSQSSTTGKERLTAITASASAGSKVSLLSPSTMALQSRNNETIQQALRHSLVKSGSYNYRAALVVESAFLALGRHCVENPAVSDEAVSVSASASSSSALAGRLLRDMVLDTLDSVDSLVATNMLPEIQVLLPYIPLVS